MAATRALSVILAAAAAAAAAETCPNLWTQANVAQSKTIQDIGADGSLRPTFWRSSELQGLFALMETGETYTMSYVATSTCGEDVAIGFYGYNGWLTSVVGARVVGRSVEAMDVAPDVSTPRKFGVRTTLTPSIDIQHTSSQNGDEDESETVTTATLDWPTCQITLADINLRKASCPAPTAAPTQGPTTNGVAPASESGGVALTSSTTTTLALPPGLPPAPLRYFGVMYNGVMDPLLPYLRNEETPVAIRYTNLIDTCTWNCMAVYSATWKDSLTKKRPSFTSPTGHDTDTRFKCAMAAVYHFTGVFLQDARPGIKGALTVLGPQLLGYELALPEALDASLAACDVDKDKQLRSRPDGFHDSTDADDARCISDAVAAANYDPSVTGQAVAELVLGYAVRDGWNCLGDRDSLGECTANGRPFKDTTGYEPTLQSASDYDRGASGTYGRLTWQPLLEDSSQGFFYRQEHVTPHIGTTSKMRVISESDKNARVAPPPEYDYDSEALLVLDRLSKLTDADKALVEYMDDKLNIILNLFGTMVQTSKFATFEAGSAFLVGYTSAEHDATVVAWKEKVRHDLVRPTTFIQRTKTTEDITTWGGPYAGTQQIRGKDFQPYKRVMPHSEYPSGSACLCEAIQEFTDAYFVRTGGQSIGLAATVAAGSSNVEPGAVPAQDIQLAWANMTQLSDDCSRSRLDGGMHFTASVPAAEALCEGIGDAGFAFASLLIDNDWVPGQPKPTPAPSHAQVNPAAATPRPTIKPTAKPTFNPTPPPLPTCQSLCDAWAQEAYSVTDTSPWCGTCTQSGVNCFTGGNSCQGPYTSGFCRQNMAGKVCTQN